MSHIESAPAPSASLWRRTVVLLTLLALSGCVTIRYQRPGSEVTPRTGETLVFGRVRFFHDGREFFPWKVSLVGDPVATNTERHLWLLRLGRRAVSSEVHPDPDGSLAIWLGSGDYALLGSTEIATEGAPPYEVVALIRVPAGPVSAYAGDLELRTESHEGGHLSRGEFGDATVTLAPITIARATVEQRLGRLPEVPATSSWCAGERVPGFNDSKLAARAKELLDQGCGAAAVQPPAPADTNDPARVALYGTGDTVLGYVTLGVSTTADAARALRSLGGLGPPRGTDITFTVGSATIHPALIFTPPGTMHQLYFDRDTLVLVVSGIPRGIPATRSEFLARYPGARETRREPGWYELQAPLGRCIWLIAVFTPGTDAIESVGQARACPAS
ncbi:MAG TPA: hypothetical protein VFU45_06530 [Gemmatimonadales bacterium]|nr:hypothetical protein [Gemmatimonadales bacterium]